MPDSLSIRSPDEMEHNGSWTLVRRSLGLKSFGVNMVDIAPGDSIPEHDETARDQEELFLALSGDVVLVVDGEDHALAEGAFARVDTQPRRTVRNDGDGAGARADRLGSDYERLRADGLGLRQRPRRDAATVGRGVSPLFSAVGSLLK